MHRSASRTLLGAAVAACLLAAPALGQASKLDARLRAKRAAPAGGIGVAAAAGPSAREHRVLLRVAPGTSPSALRASFPGVRLGVAAGDVVAATVPDAALDALAADARVREVAAATRLRPTLDVARSSTVVSGLYAGTLRNGLSDVAGLDGAGVVVGIVDTGIDWQHLDFIDDGPNASRILGIWDQTIASHADGPSPAGFGYGAEYTQAQITAKLQGGANVINTADTDGHGTHVASIAAGDGSATNGAIPAGTFKGFAPGAGIVMVKTTFYDADIVDGLSYIVQKAAAAGKRAVVNLSLGGQAGPHDGTSAFETGVSAVAAGTPVFVAMGNDHADAPHAKTTFSGLGTSNFAAAVPSPAPSAGDLEFWHPAGDAYTVTVTLLGQGGSVVAAGGSDVSGTIAGHAVQVYNATNAGHPSGDKQIYVSVTKSGGITVSQVTAALTRTGAGGSGRVDGFLDPAGQGLSWSSFADDTLTMGSPATATDVFPIGSCASKDSWDAIDAGSYSFAQQSSLGTASHFSAVGPTRDGRQAPELVAPGDVIAGALSSDPAAYPGDPYVLLDARHRILRGTSMATPAAAGVAAARLQAQPGLTVAGLKTVLRALARGDSATGSVPNATYGYGKLTASPQPVSPPAGFAVSTLGTSSIAWSWGALTAASGYGVYYATSTGSLLAAVASPVYLQTGLSANTTYGLFVRGRAGGVDGPGTFVSTATYALPAAPGAPAAFVSSVTLPFAPCPALPQALSCSGYSLAASTDAAFGGTVFSSATSNRASAQLTVSGLSALTTYYLRLATLNQYGGGSEVAVGATRTATDLQAPVSPQLSEVSSVAMRFHWAVGANPAGLTYVAAASTAPDFSGTTLSSTTRDVQALFTGLAVNTSYYFRVQAAGGPYLSHGPAATNVVAPGVPSSPFTAVSSDSLVAAWSAGANPAGTLYAAELSGQADFSGAVSSVTRGTSALFPGLVPNSVYYARVTAIGHSGSSPGAVALGSTATYAVPVSPLAAPFSGQAFDGFSFSFGPGGNPPGTRYVVRVSTDPAFSAVRASSETAGTTASFSGLLSNQLYWAQAAALNLSGAVAPFSAAQSTATSVKTPAAAAALVSTLTASSLTVDWTAAGLAAGTEYLAEAALSAGFGAVAASSQTRGTSALLSGLAADTSHYVRVRALSLNPPTPDGAPVTLGAAYTLATPPAVAAAPFSGVGASSLTVHWTPVASPCRVEVSASPSYATAVASVVAAGASSALFTGLSFSTTYYARVGALNGDGVPNFSAAGSTCTLRPLLSSATASGGAVTLSMSAPFPVFPSAVLAAEAGTFPSGAAVRIAAGTSLDLAAARAAVPLSPLGAGVAFDVDASGYQPSKPVRLTLAYDPAQVPAGQDARRLRLARYDEASALWQLVPSAVDARQRTLVASLDHFSIYAPFFTTAGSSPDDVLIFPNPWELGASGDYSGQAMTFAGLPDGASLKLLTLAGELVWEAAAGPSGVVTWDGNNRFGHKAGSATYYVVVKGGGRAVTKRAVLIR